MSTKTLRRSLFSFALTTLLAACSGGGMEAPTPPEALNAEGGWAGTSGGLTSHIYVLDDGTYWQISGNSGEALAITGLVQAHGQSNGGLYTASDARDFTQATPSDMALNGTYVKGASFNGTAGSTPFNTAPFQLSVTQASDPYYHYDTVATQTSVAGQWVVRASEGWDYTLNVAAQGTVEGYARGCLVHGTMTPRLSRKNVFDLKLTFGVAPCADPNGAYQGIVVLEPKKVTIAGAQIIGNQIIGMSVNEGRTKGFVFSAAYNGDHTQGYLVPVSL
jgi:hypothetical protein